MEVLIKLCKKCIYIEYNYVEKKKFNHQLDRKLSALTMHVLWKLSEQLELN
jgi:hypothetical protein